MHYLVVGKRQDIVFAVVITHGKRHGIMIIFAEIRVKLHILAKIMHPAHIPLKTESKTVFFHLARNLGPCGRLLRNGKKTRIRTVHHGIQMFKKFNRVKIFPAAVFIGHPLSRLLTVIQIQHGRHRINPDTVDMKLSDPVKNIGNQEIFGFCSSIIKNLGAPIRMLSNPRIGMLENTLSVKTAKSVGVSCKMSRYPV